MHYGIAQMTFAAMAAPICADPIGTSKISHIAVGYFMPHDWSPDVELRIYDTTESMSAKHFIRNFRYLAYEILQYGFLELIDLSLIGADLAKTAARLGLTAQDS